MISEDEWMRTEEYENYLIGTEYLNDERKSKTATQVTSNAPSGLPNDLGQRQTVIMDAMNEALNAGFSREYQSMIRSYFNSLKNIDSFVVTDTSRIR